MNKFLSLLLLLAVPLTIFSANFPFPQDKDYPFGIRAKNGNEKLQKAYEEWESKYYKEKGSDKAYIPDGGQAFSEGIGYGMLIMVYMDNDDNNTQEKFNKLWNSYQSHLDEHGLMNWKIGWENGEVWGEYAATDAELDAALALLMAYKQWDDEKYLSDAKDLIKKIWKAEVNDKKFLKPGDNWDDKKNPSYFSIVALELFKLVDDNDWQTVIDNSYELIKKSQNAKTGLIPDWCDEQGGNLGTNYYYDAARTPWRIGNAYSWFGHQEAYDINEKLVSWMEDKVGGNPAKIAQGYNLTGSAMNDYPSNTTFTGALVSGGVVDEKFQDWMDKGLDATISVDDQNYFQKTTQILYLIHITGNMPNMWSTSSVNEYDKSLYNDKLVVAPMPVAKNSKIMINNLKDGDYLLEVVSINGETLFANKVSVSGFYIDKASKINSLTNGVYHLVLKDKNNKIVSVERFVKIK